MHYLEHAAASVAREATLRIERVVAIPLVFLGVLVLLQLEEQNLVRAADNEHFAEVELHLANIKRRDLLKVRLLDRRLFCVQGLTLSIESVDLALGLVIERPLRKVFHRTIGHLLIYKLLRDLVLVGIEHKMAHKLLSPSEEVIVYSLITEEAAGGEWSVVSTDGQSIVFDAEEGIDIEIQNDLLEIENEEVPVAIIHVGQGELVQILVHLYGLAGDIIALYGKLFDLLLVVHVKQLDVEELVGLLCKHEGDIVLVVDDNVHDDTAASV